MHLYTTAGRGHSRKNSRDFEEMDEDGDVSFFFNVDRSNLTAWCLLLTTVCLITLFRN
jgi:hypothetical protein